MPTADLQRAQRVRRGESELGPPWHRLREPPNREVVHEADVPMVPLPFRIPQPCGAEMGLDHHEPRDARQPRKIASDAEGRMIWRFLDDQMGRRQEPGAFFFEFSGLGLRITALLRPGRAPAWTTEENGSPAMSDDESGEADPGVGRMEERRRILGPDPRPTGLRGSHVPSFSGRRKGLSGGERCSDKTKVFSGSSDFSS